MESWAGVLPDTQTLAEGLACVLGGADLPADRIKILRRLANPSARTFPSEIVTYQRSGGGEAQVFCKYMTRLNEDHRDHGSRGGVLYEALVYERVLRSCSLSAPYCYGTYVDSVHGSSWLVLEHVAGGVELGLTTEATAMKQAAAWAGRFHALAEKRLPAAPLPFLTRYDAAYYAGWARRTAEYAGPWQRRFPWLDALCRRFEDVAAELAAAPACIIHGEYYPHNILCRKGAIFPIDWESAALAVGEIDLAALTDDWSADVVGPCERAYRQARWPEGTPDGAPDGLDGRLARARLFLRFRWLGDHPGSLLAEDASLRLEELGSAARRLGLLAE
jgi:hypothetical protein